MFIIVEGPDGAGKTTFVSNLEKELWRQGRGTVLVNPKRSPRQPPLVEYKIRLDFYRPRTGVDLILDRCWYSDDVYGPSWRGHGLDPDVRSRLDTWASDRGAVVAALDADDEVLAARLEQRGDDSVEPHEVAGYAALYREQREHWYLPYILNPSIELIIELATELENNARLYKL